MGKAVEKKGKKKGRPSLLDLQKRNLKLQQEEEERKQQQQLQLRRSQKAQNPNPNPNTPVRRSTRRNPNIDGEDDDDAAGDDEDEEEAEKSTGKRRREKKLKLVNKLPNSSANSGSVNSGSDSEAEEESGDAASLKKRRIGAIGGRSGQRKDDKVGAKEEGSAISNPNSAKPDTEVEDGPSTPLPDKKLLLFILERLQKKDRYAVFAEPVDPEELPDYHEIIENPMDFTTIRKKLEDGAYAFLEQFEKDVFLLCSNAMQYNAPDTIYFRQARTIQELALKNFENLRQDSDNNEPEMKIVRRGRPPTKNLLKRPMDRSSRESAISDCPPTILDTGRENSSQPNYDLRKANSLGKFASPDSHGRTNYGSRQNEMYISWSAEKYDRADDILGSMSKGISMKHGKKQIGLDENRRSSYKVSWSPADRQDSTSALTTFRGDQKHLIPVGLHTELGYARSLARFAAKLGPIAWKVACKKLERCLPAGVKFGPGWVGENDVTLPSPLLHRSTSSAAPLPMPDCNGSKPLKATPSTETQVSSIQSPMDSHPSKSTPPSISGNATTAEAVQPSFNTLNSSNVVAAAKPGPSVQTHQQQPLLQPGINGVNGTHGFNFPTQMGKLARSARQSSAGPHSPANSPSLGNSNLRPASSVDRLFGEKWENSSTGKSADRLPRAGSAPPDLNEGFLSPGSPSRRAESLQPDLQLQLG